MPGIKRVLLVLNPVSGPKRNGAPEQDLRGPLNSAGIDIVEAIDITRTPDLPGAIAANRTGADAVVAAGGDGTVSAVAAALAGTGTPLGLFPTGTLNHFAADLGIPTGIAAAAGIIAAGHTREVDVARVNGRTFINNSSIGFYPAIVRVRDRLVTRGFPKRLALVCGVGAAAWQFPNVSARLLAGDTGILARTPLVFVGNNVYRLSGLHAASRDSLQDGVLQVCTMTDPRRRAMFRALALALIGNTEAAPELRLTTAREARVETLRKRVAVALDGEVFMMRSPLVYSIWPLALRVLAPAEPAR